VYVTTCREAGVRKFVQQGEHLGSWIDMHDTYADMDGSNKHRTAAIVASWML
jgi:hypothetical protein